MRRDRVRGSACNASRPHRDAAVGGTFARSQSASTTTMSSTPARARGRDGTMDEGTVKTPSSVRRRRPSRAQRRGGVGNGDAFEIARCDDG